MIIDKLDNGTEYYGLGGRIKKALEYLKSTDLAELEPGKYQIENDEIYAMVSEYDTKSVEEVLWEAHKSYIDIQYMINGSEKMGYTNAENIKVTTEYDSEKDILFGTADGDFVTVEEGMFIIFKPQDGHMPSIRIDDSERVKKVVVKVLAE
ncbi:YhcH/YjgK/YiaL family protein [Clostridium folliculivorans]|uniref:Beta-D-galactosidase n=1 Tax=Clostridium folliculivorans TaxID=2886038 RepID=A0A9W5Y4X6_9CLOT|nr:YhcH/YjgK/YiaL family protein [Clostridium folliculivorans]GKU26600.1 beta-D-galactosidase [Clostridium folliculivorans]GKU28968.1 beta-D-galactosidase [Clostridium folliculivorans]